MYILQTLFHIFIFKSKIKNFIVGFYKSFQKKYDVLAKGTHDNAGNFISFKDENSYIDS